MVTPAIGSSVGNYRILSKLGEGGMGVVYLAEDMRLERRVALKALSAAFATDSERRQRFLTEARAAAALSHPGIAAVYELEEAEGSLYIVFEYIEGAALPDMCRRLAGPQRYAGLVIVAALLLQAGMAAASDVGLAAGLGLLAMGGLVSVLYIDPIVKPPTA